MTATKWTKFWDMHSGGSQKLDWAFIFIEAPLKEAEIIFQNRFGRKPNRVTCTGCGSDYSIDEGDSLEQLTGYHRNCRYGYFDKKGKEITKDEAWVCGEGMVNGATAKYVEKQDEEKSAWGKFLPFEKFLKTRKFGRGLTGEEKVLVIFKEDIKPGEREGELEEEGYVWVD